MSPPPARQGSELRGTSSQGRTLGRRSDLSRRDLLACFLGLSAARSACERPRTRDTIPGGLVDRAVETGHLLRGPPLPRASEVTDRCEVLVVGAGAAGLCAAWRLRGDGISDLLVLEVDEAPGGTSRGGRNAFTSFPWGAHYLPAPLSAAGPVPRLLQQLGVMVGVDEHGAPRFDEACLVHEPEERLFYRGAWYEGLYLTAGATDDDLAQAARFTKLMDTFASARDGRGRKAFDVPLERGSDDAEWTALDRMSMADWLTLNAFTSPRLWWMVDYACRDDYGSGPADTSAWAGVWYFASRQLGDARHEGFLSWPEGNAHLVDALAGSVEAERLRPGTLVHTLEPDEGGGWTAHAWDAAARAPRRVRAREVVFAAPRFVAPAVIAPWRTAPPPWLRAFQYVPWLVANLTLSAPPRSRGFPLSWDNVLYDSKSLGYVVARHQELRSDTGGPTVLTWYLPLTGADVLAERSRLLSAGYPEWEAIILGDLGRAHVDLERLVERIDVMRWGHAMVRPRPGFMWGPERRSAAAPLPGLHFAHSDLSGLALFEEASHHGVRAAEEVLASLGRPSPSWL